MLGEISVKSVSDRNNSHVCLIKCVESEMHNDHRYREGKEAKLDKMKEKATYQYDKTTSCLNWMKSRDATVWENSLSSIVYLVDYGQQSCACEGFSGAKSGLEEVLFWFVCSKHTN